MSLKLNSYTHQGSDRDIYIPSQVDHKSRDKYGHYRFCECRITENPLRYLVHPEASQKHTAALLVSLLSQSTANVRSTHTLAYCGCGDEATTLAR